MSTAMERLWNGMVKENPTFVLMLGMCPTLAVTTSAINGIGYGADDDGDSCAVKSDDPPCSGRSFRMESGYRLLS